MDDEQENDQMTGSMEQDFEIEIDDDGEGEGDDSNFQGEGPEEFEDDGEENPEELSEAEGKHQIRAITLPVSYSGLADSRSG